MTRKEATEFFTEHFKSWGTKATNAVARLTRKHGVLLSAYKFSNGKKG